MRTCASCGKANNPIRKYCTRCGKSLISLKEDKPSSTPTSVVTETPIPDIQPTVSSPEDTYVRSDSVKATTDDEWVRPSQVSRDRVRSRVTSSGKSEMEKAKEAFARAEGVGIDEADGSGIVETRMLRASEVRELMGEGAVISQEPAPPTQPAPQAVPTLQPTAPTTPPPQTPPPATSTPSPTAPPVTPSTPSVAEPTPQPDPTPAAPAPSIIPAMPTTNKFEPATTPAPPVQTPPPAAPVGIPVKPPTPKPTVTSAASITLDTKVPEIEDVLSQVTETEDLQDSKIKDLIASLTTQHAELRKVKEDMANVAARLDDFVRSCQNDAEVKRIHYESLCEQERFAKQEYESSKKEYERVDKRRKKEISSLEGKVKTVEKNISKTEDAVKKRITELDKVREKIAQLQTDGQ
ncbi:MAG: hypothetical protein RTV31_10070 [Candidatus Thorarchaeota archaeon]